MTGAEILAIEMAANDADAGTVRDYFKALLERVWEREELFSGKRPFGNSGWQADIEGALVRGMAVPGKLDEEGYPLSFDQEAMDEAIEKAIQAL